MRDQMLAGGFRAPHRKRAPRATAGVGRGIQRKKSIGTLQTLFFIAPPDASGISAYFGI
jgi:hypothetical protein